MTKNNSPKSLFWPWFQMAESSHEEGMRADGRHRSRSRKLRDHVFSSTREVERVNGKWGPAMDSQRPPPGMDLLRKAAPSHRFPNSASNCQSGAPMPEVMVDTFLPNNHIRVRIKIRQQIFRCTAPRVGCGVNEGLSVTVPHQSRFPLQI